MRDYSTNIVSFHFVQHKEVAEAPQSAVIPLCRTANFADAVHHHTVIVIPACVCGDLWWWSAGTRFLTFERI